MYEIRCDLCRSVTESGGGSPGGVAKRRVLCAGCAAVAQGVDAEISRLGHQKALALSEELEALRRRRMMELLPVQANEGPREGLTAWPLIEPATEQGGDTE